MKLSTPLLYASLLLTSCAAHFTPAPAPSDAPMNVNGVRLVNGNQEANPRLYFNDGITKYQTSYRGWSQSVVTRFAESMSRRRPPTGTDKTLTFSILGITCSGHYVADCSASLQVTRGDGVSKVYSTDPLNGWPLGSALDKALDASVAMVITDPDLLTYLR